MIIKFSKKAKLQLNNIYSFIALKSEIAATKRYNKILDKIDRLSHSPLIGYVDKSYNPRGRREFRALVVRPYYKINYYVSGQTVTIIDIWDTRQDNEN